MENAGGPGIDGAVKSLPEALVRQLEEHAYRLRRDVLEMVTAARSGHPGGSLSSAEIVATLFFHTMRFNPREPKWPGRDRFILSKGHAAPVLYAALARTGHFPVEELARLRKSGSHLQGHPDQTRTPGVEVSTGSLGQGFSVAQGAALAGKLDGAGYRVYVLIGDGEMNEGQIWEAALFAAHHKLDNLTGLVDVNGLQNDTFVADTLITEPIVDKWRAFGWHVLDVDGHDVRALAEALDVATETKGRPTMIVCRTVKGKGVSFMENNPEFHGKAPTPEQLAQALGELELARSRRQAGG
ncbi:MAG: transketolase [Chloroflexi bacterium]|nr:transketolase [Chloroflexota bacterium]